MSGESSKATTKEIKIGHGTDQREPGKTSTNKSGQEQRNKWLLSAAQGKNFNGEAEAQRKASIGGEGRGILLTFFFGGRGGWWHSHWDSVLISGTKFRDHLDGAQEIKLVLKIKTKPHARKVL